MCTITSPLVHIKVHSVAILSEHLNESVFDRNVPPYT